jgi:branched-chain amino acid transport system permease protein
MFYREAGQFKSDYVADQAIFPILQDRIGLAVIVTIALVIPLTANDFIVNAVMIPFMIFALAAMGLNLLTGYTGLLSLGTGAFMGVGAYACYKLTSIFPNVNILIWVLLGGGRRHLRFAVTAYQGLLSGHRDARRPVLPGVVLRPHSLALQL